MKKTILQALQRRYATKKFDTTKKISLENLETLEESLRLTPSSFWLQAWKFFRVDTSVLREKLRPIAYGQTQIKEASYLYVLAHRTEVKDADIEKYLEDIIQKRWGSREQLQGFFDMIQGKTSSLDAEKLHTYLKSQVYIAAGFLMETCALLKIDCCPMEGFDNKACDGLLWLTEKWYTAALLMPVGYRHEDDPYIQRKKVRFAMDEVFEVL